MTDDNHQRASSPVLPDGELIDVTELGKRVIAMDPRETLMACPINDVELTREPEYPCEAKL